MFETVMFYIAHVSFIMLSAMLAIVIRFRAKTKLSKHFVAYIVELLVWTVSVISSKYALDSGNEAAAMAFENLTYVGTSFIAATVLLMGISLNRDYQKKRLRMILVCLVPAITQIIIWTNPFHHLFYVNYDFYNPANIRLGWYFWIHTVYSYACLITGMSLIIKFAFNSRGNSRWQAMIIIFGSLIPLFVNLCYTLGVRSLSVFSTPIAFMITVATYLIGIVRFNLLRATPIALRTVIDRISDLYVVIDENLCVIDYNAPFSKVFGKHVIIRKNMDIRRAVEDNEIGISAESFFGIIEYCRETGALFSKEFKMLSDGRIKYFDVEFTPLLIETTYCGCILLLRDITQAKANMEEIKRNQNMLIERERLASLGQLMGGIAHNLKTPILAASGRVESLHALINEYEKSVGSRGVTKKDHIEIAGEMRQEVNKVKDHISYISDIISAVKEQTVKFSAEKKETFTVDELIKRVGILLQHELISKGCKLKIEFSAGSNLMLSGDITSLIQVLDNIIINAIYAYKGAAGVIELKVWKEDGRQELNILIADKAGGIAKEVQDKLFRQMVTTKGTDGTGLGLYISHATVAGMFGGKMAFTSVPGQGTEFIITLPLEAGAREAGRLITEEKM